MPIFSGCHGKKKFKPLSHDILILTEFSAVWAYNPIYPLFATHFFANPKKAAS